MKKIFFSFFVLAAAGFFISGCSAARSLTAEDKSLLELISGSWTSTNYQTLIFNKDLTFTDTLFSEQPYLKEKQLVPLYAAEGTFTIRNGIIFFEEVKINYLRAAADKNISAKDIVFYPRLILPEGKDLFLQEINVLESNIGRKELSRNTWLSVNPAAFFNRNFQHEISYGTVTEEYDFYADSLMIFRKKFSNDNSGNVHIKAGYFTEGNTIYIISADGQDPLWADMLYRRNDALIKYFQDAVLYKRVN
jgi:hypothetical protein